MPAIWDILFLSTLSLRRATASILHKILADWDFYPRSPCGERQATNGLADTPPKISIHALLAESDLLILPSKFTAWAFLSTLSLRRATSPRCGWLEVIYYFYPRSPCGERQQAQSLKIPAHRISIHALLAESDKLTVRQSGLLPDFYPRSPCGERPA